MGQIVVLDHQDVVASWDIDPEWYKLRPHPADAQTVRTPTPGARIACAGDFAIASYRVVDGEGTHHSRIAIVNARGDLLMVRDRTAPVWPDPGVGTLIAGGTRLILGVSNLHTEFPTVAVYEIRGEQLP